MVKNTTRTILWMRMRRALFLLLIFSFFLTGCDKESVDDNDQGTEEPEVPKTPEQPTGPPEEHELGPPIEPQAGDFTIVAIPDTQYYSSHPEHGGVPEMFYAQIDWIKENQVEENIVYVAHLGDITNDGDNPETAEYQWSVATKAMYGLEYPKSIPYGVAVGNHDQFPWGHALSSTTEYFNRYFGVEYFKDRPYYGGNMAENNDNHYDFFSAGGIDFLVVYIEYDRKLEHRASIQWADEIIKQYPEHKVIVVNHFLIGNNEIKGTNDGKPGAWSDQGVVIYEELKDNTNIFMMVCGHVAGNGEGFREDTFNGNTIRTFLSDYQGRRKGGGGLMRTYKISVEDNQISVSTFSPYSKVEETDGDSKFVTPLFD